jgi:hypothetical protein
MISEKVDYDFDKIAKSENCSDLIHAGEMYMTHVINDMIEGYEKDAVHFDERDILNAIKTVISAKIEAGGSGTDYLMNK